jgi:hypothetical protein
MPIFPLTVLCIYIHTYVRTMCISRFGLVLTLQLLQHTAGPHYSNGMRLVMLDVALQIKDIQCSGIVGTVCVADGVQC